MKFDGPYTILSSLTDEDEDGTLTLNSSPMIGNGLLSMYALPFCRRSGTNATCDNAVAAVMNAKHVPCPARFYVKKGKDDMRNDLSEAVCTRKSASLDTFSATLSAEFSVYDADGGTQHLANIHSSTICLRHAPTCAVQRVRITRAGDTGSTNNGSPPDTISMFHGICAPRSPSDTHAAPVWNFESFQPSYELPYHGYTCYSSAEFPERVVCVSCYVWDDYADAKRIRGHRGHIERDGRIIGFNALWHGSEDDVGFYVVSCVVKRENAGSDTGDSTASPTTMNMLILAARRTLSVLLDSPSPDRWQKSRGFSSSPDAVIDQATGINALSQALKRHNREWARTWAEGDVLLVPSDTNAARVSRLSNRLRYALYNMHCTWGSAASVYAVRQTAKVSSSDAVQDTTGGFSILAHTCPAVDSALPFLEGTLEAHVQLIWVIPALTAMFPSVVPDVLQSIFDIMQTHVLRGYDAFFSASARDDGLGETRKPDADAADRGAKAFAEQASALCLAFWSHWLSSRDTNWLSRKGFRMMSQLIDQLRALHVHSPSVWETTSSNPEGHRGFFRARVAHLAIRSALEAAALLGIMRGHRIREGWQTMLQYLKSELSKADDKADIEADDAKDPFLWGDAFLDFLIRDKDETGTIVQRSRASSLLLDKFDMAFEVDNTQAEEEEEKERGRRLLLLLWLASTNGSVGRRSRHREIYDPFTKQNDALENALTCIEALGNLLETNPDGKGTPWGNMRLGAEGFEGANDPRASAVFVMSFLVSICGYAPRGGITTGGLRYAYGDFSTPQMSSGNTRALPSALKRVDVIYSPSDRGQGTGRAILVQRR